MRLKILTTAIVVVMAALGYVAWRSSARPAATESGSAPSDPAPAGEAPMAETPADAGIAWKAPAGWEDEGARPMRLATYRVPGANGGSAAECAVFYFGPGQGGTPEANIERWLGEFQNPHDVRNSTATAGGMRVFRVGVRGTYQSHGGDAAPHGAAPADQALIGAIVEGPRGLVFFKLTGATSTLAAAAGDFDRMIGSLRRH